MTLLELNDLLHLSWSRETAYRLDRPNWSEDNKAVGQCAITAIVVFDYMGGVIERGYSAKYNLYHYWNVIDGKTVDLTFSQFSPDKSDITFTKITRKSKESMLKIRDVCRRYTLLSERVKKNNEDRKNVHFKESFEPAQACSSGEQIQAAEETWKKPEV